MSGPSGARARVAVAGVLLSVALVLSIGVAVTIGPADIRFGEVWASIASNLGLGTSPLSPLRDGIVWELRLPRVLTAAAVGAGLAIAGAVMQAITRNSLADPYLLGLSSGASLGAVAVLVVGVSVLLPAAAFVGALVALAATLLIAGAGASLTPSRTILAGIAVSSLFAALTSFVIFWTATGDSYREILSWLLGSLAGARWPAVAIAFGAVLVIGVPLMVSGRALDAFAFGDTSAAALGVHVTRTRWVLLVGTALLTGGMVAVSGSIGFVGLILPHAVRLVVGARHRALLPLAALSGAIFLVWCDTAARTIFDPRELPVGIITAVVGAPVFVLLLMRSRSTA
ncbi:putative F420-0 ABC transporter permease subunit [Marisediminicola senii]|uniref:putative F420-0 ABC transporter permease subunit n=1 Tax=Marisediminicola senii TaxID=2711233 RepID=UPI00191172BA|nr:putative F420-0 ABC transporter permease subunit [Marisediminicola senii]